MYRGTAISENGYNYEAAGQYLVALRVISCGLSQRICAGSVQASDECRETMVNHERGLSGVEELELKIWRWHLPS